MLELKPISKESIPNALRKAKQYRWLNEPWQAESICRDILQVEPTNQLATLTLILAITDQFEKGSKTSDLDARKLCEVLTDPYQQKYYRGIIAERMGKAALKRESPRVKYIAYEYFSKALEWYKEAEKIHPKDNEESILRWNSCIRTIETFKLEAAPDGDDVQPMLDV